MLMAPCTEIPMLSIANKIVRVSKAKSQCTCEFAVCACRMHGRPFGMQSNFQPRGPGPKNSNALPRIFGGHGKACLGMTKGQWAMRASLACPHGKCFGGCLFYCAWLKHRKANHHKVCSIKRHRCQCTMNRQHPGFDRVLG